MTTITVYFPEQKELTAQDLERYLIKTNWIKDSCLGLWRHESGKSEIIFIDKLQSAIEHLKAWEKRATGLIYLDIVGADIQFDDEVSLIGWKRG